MLVSGYNNIILLPNCTMLYYVFSGPLSLRAYVPEIKFNNAMQCSAMQCNARQCNAIQCNTIQYNTFYFQMIIVKVHHRPYMTVEISIIGKGGSRSIILIKCFPLNNN